MLTDVILSQAQVNTQSITSKWKKYFSSSHEYLPFFSLESLQRIKQAEKRRECYENAAGRYRLTDVIDVCVNNEKGKKRQKKRWKISLLTISWTRYFSQQTIRWSRSFVTYSRCFCVTQKGEKKTRAVNC